MVNRGLAGVSALVQHLLPMAAWRYEGGKRDLRLDLLRGFAVIAMVTDHIGGERSWLYGLTGGDAFFVSAAEVFIFISGLLMGIIYAGVIARQGLGPALMKTLQRAWSLYLMTITLTLTFMVLSMQLRLGWDLGLMETSWTDLIASVLTLHRTFYLTDVLLLYTFLVLASVPVLILLAHGQTRFILAMSWGLWGLWQVSPQHAQVPWPIADNSVFNFPAWQVLFITAMVLGYHRQRVEQFLSRLSAPMVLGGSLIFVTSAIAVHVVWVQPMPLSQVTLIDQFFAKVDLRIGRLIAFGGFFTFAFVLLTLAWRPIQRALSWLLLPLGQDALSAYILHLFVVALAVKVRPLIFGTLPATPTANMVFQLIGIAFIWAAIILRPLALTQLRAWFVRTVGLLAAARPYSSLADHSSRHL